MPTKPGMACLPFTLHDLNDFNAFNNFYDFYGFYEPTILSSEINEFSSTEHGARSRGHRA
jgi:hypothetical protein